MATVNSPQSFNACSYAMNNPFLYLYANGEVCPPCWLVLLSLLPEIVTTRRNTYNGWYYHTNTYWDDDADTDRNSFTDAIKTISIHFVWLTASRQY